MTQEIGATEARLALDSIERRRHQVVAEINVPPWYWPALAGGWIALGAVAQFGSAWVATAATLAFGAAHAAVASRVLSGRHGSSRLSVRRDLVSRRVPLYVIGFLVGMTAATAAIAVVLNADGEDHPALAAGVVVAALVLSAGPNLMALIRRRAGQRLLG